MQATFNGQPGLLKQMFWDLKVRLENLVPALIFEQRTAATTVPMPCGEGSTGEIVLQPWHLPYSPEYSVKGQSKMVYVLRLFEEFVEKSSLRSHSIALRTKLQCLSLGWLRVHRFQTSS